jgi:hypothetical protein
MSSITEEIQQLQLKLNELEKQKKEKEEKEEDNKKTSISFNFEVINNLLNEKKTAITNNRYSKSISLARYYDQELVTHLEAIYNILQVFNEKLDKLENNNK